MNTEIVNKLAELKQVGASWQREAKGEQVIRELESLLPDDEWRKLYTARAHSINGEGRGELDALCNDLIAKYRADVEPRNFKKALL